MERTIRIYEVTYNTGNDGAHGDGIGTFRTKDRAEAAKFAAGKTCYSELATVDTLDVPARIARRWGF